MGLIKKTPQTNESSIFDSVLQGFEQPMNQKQGVSPKETDPENQNQNQEQ